MVAKERTKINILKNVCIDHFFQNIYIILSIHSCVDLPVVDLPVTRYTQLEARVGGVIRLLVRPDNICLVGWLSEVTVVTAREV